VAEERARIARELHDVVAHSVSIISVQAGAAEMLARRDPPRAREAVAAVLTAAHQALAELRQLVDMLGGDDDATLAYQPQPGLPDLAELVANGRELGLAIDLVDEREPSEIPAGVQLTVYRIVQEALTNAAKHAGRVPVSVRLFGRPGELDVEIRNPMTADSVDGADTGHGLLGMRERVRLYGGHLAAGPDPERCWLVRVTLPVEEGEAQGDPDLDRR
jgi:signal transduction histidine kinase